MSNVESGVGECAHGYVPIGVIEQAKNVGMFAEEGGGTAVEVEFLGEFGEKLEGNVGVLGVGKNEILD